MVELALLKGHLFYCRLTKPLCGARMAALQVMNSIDVLVYAINDNIIPKEPMQIPAIAATCIQNDIVGFVPAFHDLIHQVNIRGAYYFFQRIRSVFCLHRSKIRNNPHYNITPTDYLYCPISVNRDICIFRKWTAKGMVMSYPKFTKALNDYYVRQEAGNLPSLDVEEVLALVRDEWIRDKRYKELVGFILENWDSGNCDDFSRPLSQHLIEIKENALFIRLWRGILRNRLEKLWRDFAILQSKYPNITLAKIKQVNVTNYDQFSSSETIQRRVAWRRLYIINGTTEFMAGLRELNETEELEKQNRLLDIVANLEKPMPKPATDKRKIDENLFWELIDESRKLSPDQFGFIDNLRSLLERFDAKELRNFKRILLTKVNELNTWEHWALAYIVRHGCGDDAFDYFKAWVVSKGRHAFFSVKNLREGELALIFDEDPQLEELYGLAEEIYEQKTSDSMPDVRIKPGKLTGKRWEEDKLAEAFPSLCKLFNY